MLYCQQQQIINQIAITTYTQKNEKYYYEMFLDFDPTEIEDLLDGVTLGRNRTPMSGKIRNNIILDCSILSSNT